MEELTLIVKVPFNALIAARAMSLWEYLINAQRFCFISSRAMNTSSIIPYGENMSSMSFFSACLLMPPTYSLSYPPVINGQ